MTYDRVIGDISWLVVAVTIAGWLFRKRLHLGEGSFTVAVGTFVVLLILTPASPPYQGPYTGEEPTMKLGVFGGVHHDVYLGCLNCSARDADSMRSYASVYGMSPTATRSIFRRGSPYAAPDSDLSACNPAATSPPIVLDERGHMVGSLDEDLSNTIREVSPDAAFMVRVMACHDQP